MTPIRNGRLIIFLLPYTLIVTGILAASKVAGAPGGIGTAFQALGIGAIGGFWAWRRGRRSSY
ncbi:hypothetical protein [Streptomyces stelliscabiei]|uniref:hypothetical protein n=1 Tax=Streptomyces stelliscabiei TaxID=146820 RepID=UPI0029B5DF0C|nr:hypothetical protein [Streptomyces stelliscabiei]MDX3435629.1 hypothetical protein [Streptomyces stelliscabiei]MDX3622072.1 hypothetical protein [Streptomyces stelliscabiei]